MKITNDSYTRLAFQKVAILGSVILVIAIFLGASFGQDRWPQEFTTQDGTISVVTVVDRSGTVKIQNVLEYPADNNLLTKFNDMIESARARPASQNGRAVDAHLVMTFSKISVYD